MESELKDAMNCASSSSEVRVIILTGEGRGFCAGADMSLLNDVQESQSSSDSSRQNDSFSRLRIVGFTARFRQPILLLPISDQAYNCGH